MSLSKSNLQRTRTLNLQRLVDEATQGNVHAFARRISFNSLPNYMGDPPKTLISDRVARHIEAQVGLPAFSLDHVNEFGSALSADSPLIDQKPPTAAMLKIDGVQFPRKRNLERLVDYYANSNTSHFSTKFGFSSLSNYIGARWSRNIGDRLAKDIETKLKLPLGALSHPNFAHSFSIFSTEEIELIIERKTLDAATIGEQIHTLTTERHNTENKLLSLLTDALVLNFNNGDDPISVHGTRYYRALANDPKAHELVPQGWPWPLLLMNDCDDTDIVVVVPTKSHRFRTDWVRYLEWLQHKQMALSHYRFQYVLLTSDMPFKHIVLDTNTIAELLKDPDKFYNLDLRILTFSEVWCEDIRSLHDALLRHQSAHISLTTQLEEKIDELLMLHQERITRTSKPVQLVDETNAEQYSVFRYSFAYIKNLAALYYHSSESMFYLLIPIKDMFVNKECREYLDKFVKENSLGNRLKFYTFDLTTRLYSEMTIDSRTSGR